MQWEIEKLYIVPHDVPYKGQQGDREEEHEEVDGDAELVVELVEAGGREEDVDGEAAQLGEDDEQVDRLLKDSG